VGGVLFPAGLSISNGRFDNEGSAGLAQMNSMTETAIKE
jgi:hypothetical protein